MNFEKPPGAPQKSTEAPEPKKLRTIAEVEEELKNKPPKELWEFTDGTYEGFKPLVNFHKPDTSGSPEAPEDDPAIHKYSLPEFTGKQPPPTSLSESARATNDALTKSWLRKKIKKAPDEPDAPEDPSKSGPESKKP